MRQVEVEMLLFIIGIFSVQLSASLHSRIQGVPIQRKGSYNVQNKKNQCKTHSENNQLMDVCFLKDEN